MTGSRPSAGVNWLALSRAWKPGGPPTDAAGLRVAVLVVVLRPAAAEVERLQVPRRLGEAEPVRPVVHAVVHREQVRQRRVDVVALRRRERLAGLQRCVNHWFVHVYVYSRSGLGVAGSRCRATCPTLLFQFSTASALLPRVVKVGDVAARVEVPHRRGRVVEDQRAVGRGQPAPAHARVGARVVLRRRVAGTPSRSGCRPGGRRALRGRAPRRSRRRRTRRSRRHPRAATSPRPGGRRRAASARRPAAPAPGGRARWRRARSSRAAGGRC